MSVPYRLARDSGTDSDTGEEDIFIEKDGFKFQIMRGQEWKGNECGNSLKCEKCDIQFLSVWDFHHHMLGGNREVEPRRHFYCGKCRIDFLDEKELKDHKVESSEHYVCLECFREFPTVEQLLLHRKQLHKPKPVTTHECPGCKVLFTTISGITQHIESGQCQSDLSPEQFRNMINYENTPLAQKGLPASVLAGSTTTHTWRTGILPKRVKTALTETPEGFNPEKLVPKNFVGVLDYTLPAKPATSPSVENPSQCWNKMLQAYLCPRPKCGKKFKSPDALKAHLESVTHDKKVFRCPTCTESFVSSSALLQHAESETCGVKRSKAYKQLIKGATGGLMDGSKKPEYKTGW